MEDQCILMYCGGLILSTLFTLSHSSWLPRLSPSNGGWDTTMPHRQSRSVVGATTRHLRTWTWDHTDGVFNPKLKFRLCARRSVKLVNCPMRVQLRSKSHSPVLIFQINYVYMVLATLHSFEIISLREWSFWTQ